MHVDDALAFILDFARNLRANEYVTYSTYGYELYMPIVIAAYIKEVERSSDQISNLMGSRRADDLSPFFYEAAWTLCRQGVLRPGIKGMRGQATADGASGNGYSLTSQGRVWMAAGPDAAPVFEAGRMGELFGNLAKRLGPGFLQRANEAARCHAQGMYLACCAMCGAAAELILLAVAAAKIGEEPTLAVYRTSKGRHRIIDRIVGQSGPVIANPFRSATELLAYWRDDAAHGRASTISEIEAHVAVSRLLRFAQFTIDNWAELTRP